MAVANTTEAPAVRQCVEWSGYGDVDMANTSEAAACELRGARWQKDVLDKFKNSFGEMATTVGTRRTRCPVHGRFEPPFFFLVRNVYSWSWV